MGQVMSEFQNFLRMFDREEYTLVRASAFQSYNQYLIIVRVRVYSLADRIHNTMHRHDGRFSREYQETWLGSFQTNSWSKLGTTQKADPDKAELLTRYVRNAIGGGA
jgi:hypothetical protein